MGHNALGAGQLIDQGASLVDNSLRTGSMFSGEGWQYITPSFENNTVHFIGLLSDGGVHSRTDQLYGCLRGAAQRGAKKIRCAGGLLPGLPGRAKQGGAVEGAVEGRGRLGSSQWGPCRVAACLGGWARVLLLGIVGAAGSWAGLGWAVQGLQWL